MKNLSKLKLGAYVLALFLAGAGSAAFLTYEMCRNMMFDQPTPEKIGANIRARLQSQLHLTPEQAQKIDPLIDKAMTEVRSNRRDFVLRLITNKSNLNAQILHELTPEQTAKFEQMESERLEILRKKFGAALDNP